MHELDFQPAVFRGRRFAGHRALGGDAQGELAGTESLARSVVAALIRGAAERDVRRLTDVAFAVSHPERDPAKRIDPAAEPQLAAEWKALKSSIVMPALAGTPASASEPPAKLSSAPGVAPSANVSSGTILLIGDSHTYGAFGNELARLLEAAGASVVRHAKIGSAVKYWLPRVPALLREHRPATVIIALGANMRGYPSARGISAQIRKLVDLVRRDAPAARLVWIGPPRQRDDSEATLQRFDATVRAGLDRDTVFIASAPHTPTYRGRDGVHYAEDTAKRWARGVFGRLR